MCRASLIEISGSDLVWKVLGWRHDEALPGHPRIPFLSHVAESCGRCGCFSKDFLHQGIERKAIERNLEHTPCVNLSLLILSLQIAQPGNNLGSFMSEYTLSAASVVLCLGIGGFQHERGNHDSLPGTESRSTELNPSDPAH